MDNTTFCGKLGVLEYDPISDKIQCHICGKWFRGLNTHVWQAHHWTVDEYREEFGLNKGQSLICQGTRILLGEINLRLGNWKHLNSQTMSKEDLIKFLSQFKHKGYQLRLQTNLGKSERLTQFNPMNEPEVMERKILKERETWYGTERQRSMGKSNIQKALVTIRTRNLNERKYTCPCGQIFSTLRGSQHHRRDCAIARDERIKKMLVTRKITWENKSPEERKQFGKHVSEGKKRQYSQAQKSC